MESTMCRTRMVKNCLSWLLVVWLISPIECEGWFSEVIPKRTWNYSQESPESGLVQTFISNHSHDNFFKILASDAHSILVGGRNHVFNLSTSDLSENIEQRITWFPTDKDRELCLVKGKSENDCHNYIRVLSVLEQGTKLLICGTNAFNPKCRHYHKPLAWSPSWVFSAEFSGKGFCPYDPRHNSSAIFAGGHLYSGTVADFSGTDPLIIRERLRTEQYDLKHLNDPDFVGSFEDGEYVYFFFRETATEHMNCGEGVFARVARVCKQDKGGPHTFQNKWTTFLKARLNCSVPGDIPFHFDHIQSVVKVERSIYGVFTTQDNSMPGSAICEFSLATIEAAFQQDLFKSQSSVNSNWLPIPSSDTPEPRPGLCSSSPITERGLNFIKRNNLMNQAIPSQGQKPLFVQASFQERFLSIAVKEYDYDHKLIIVGTTHGRVLKLVTDSNGQSTLLEAIRLHSDPIKQVVIADTQRIISLHDNQLHVIALDRCGSLSSCSGCLSVPQDPFCKWNHAEEKCIRSFGTAYQTDLLQRLNDCPTETVSVETTTELPREDTTIMSYEYEDASVNMSLECPSCSCECPIESTTQVKVESSTLLPSAFPDHSSPLPVLAPTNSEDPAGNEIQFERRRKDLDIFLDFIDDGSTNGNLYHLEEKYLPKRESPSKLFGRSFSERTVIAVSILSSVISLLLGFVLGLLISKLCQKRSKSEEKSLPASSVSTISDQTDPASMQKPMNLDYDDPDGDDHGFKSLPIHHSTTNGAALMFPSAGNYAQIPVSLRGSFTDINQNSLVVMTSNMIGTRNSISCGQSLRGSSSSREAVSAPFTSSTNASPSSVGNFSRGPHEATISSGGESQPSSGGAVNFLPNSGRRIYL